MEPDEDFDEYADGWDEDEDEDEEEKEVVSLLLQPGETIRYNGEDWTVMGHYMWEGNPTYFIADAEGNQSEGWYYKYTNGGGRFDPV